jgi:hypothetical protein
VNKAADSDPTNSDLQTELANAQALYDYAVTDEAAKKVIQTAADKAVKDATAALAQLKKDQAAALKQF